MAYLSALSFEVGRSDYYDQELTRDYLERLAKYEFFRYIIFVGKEGEFRGLIPARDLLSQLEAKEALGQVSDMWKFFILVIENDELNEIRGIITQSIQPDTVKREALKVMAEHRLTELPVVKDNKLIGVVQRDMLIDSVLVEFFAGL